MFNVHKDLETGMILEFERDKAIVLGDLIITLRQGGNKISVLGINLNHSGWGNLLRVYSMPKANPNDHIGTDFCDLLKDHLGSFSKVLWDRKKAMCEEMTLAQVCEALGKEIKIIK